MHLGIASCRIGLLFCLLCGGPAPALELSGKVSLLDKNKPLTQVENVVAYFRPDQPVALPEDSKPYRMTTQRKQFVPKVLPITAGSTVVFPNSDPILHNVFSTTRGNAFDVGLYGQGDGESQQFDQPGLVRVFCNVHQSMVGHILVLDTPFFTPVDSDGRFSLVGLPPGKGKLYLWHERAKPLVRELNLPVIESLDFELSLTKRLVPNHKNKLGRKYKRDRRGRY